MIGKRDVVLVVKTIETKGKPIVLIHPIAHTSEHHAVCLGWKRSRPMTVQPVKMTKVSAVTCKARHVSINVKMWIHRDATMRCACLILSPLEHTMPAASLAPAVSPEF
jgi:hypothetical protein